MKEEKIENENLPEKADEKKEVHYHYHMDEKGMPQSPGPTEKKPGEVHYHYYYEPPKMTKPRSSKPTIAGILLLIHGIFNIALILLLIFAGVFVSDLGSGFEFFGEEGTGDITGTVTFLSGAPVENATISVVDTQFITTTDENGDYLIYNVPSGNQKIMVEFEGYNTIILKTFVEPENMDMQTDQNGNTDQNKNEHDFVLTEGDEILERGSYPPFEFIRNVLLVCAAVLIVLSIFSLIGAYAAFKRENFKLAIGGAIAGVVSLGLFALIALFILLLAKDEFKKSQKDIAPMGPVGGGIS
ncbi:MAG: carboxypeptidase regulatory-like domain-containing protein [Thermoplasmata archaeon]|nr:MAG: carboxypeptidase regulatory-like domain-containing protein [Thermoplasmata archaeon]